MVPAQPWQRRESLIFWTPLSPITERLTLQHRRTRMSF